MPGILRVVFLSGAFAALAAAQADANKAQLFGTVLDPNGAVVPGAKIKVTNIGAGFSRELESSGEGQFRFVQLDPGSYEITAQAKGFAENRLTGISLNVGAAISIDIRLQVQSTTTSIDVSETLINISLPAAATTLGSQAIRDLPINGRRFHDFATLTPTVQIEPQRQQLSFAGQRGVNANVMVDGADYNQPFFGGIRGGERSNFNFTLPQSAVQEFQAVTTGYAAEYGRSTGGVLNVITKSGANNWHGDAFYQNRDRSLSADNPIFLVQPSESLQQWGASAGGAVRRDKLFVFGAYEQQKANTPREVLFPLLATVTPSPATQEAISFLQGQQQKFTQTNRAAATTARSDYVFTNGDRLTLRYNFADSNEENAVSVGGAVNPFTNSALSNEGTEKDRNHFGTVQHTRLFSPRLVNDLKFSGSYEERPRLANSNTPTVSASPLALFGARSFLPTVQWDRRIQLTDSLSILAGKHSFKIGLDYSKLDTAQAFGFNQFGGFSLNTSNVARLLTLLSTAPGQNRFDGTEVVYNRQIGNLLAEYGMHQAAFFAQDSWRVTPRLTLDFGLRWEAQYNPSVIANNEAVVSRVHDVPLPNGARLNVKQIKNNLDQFAPRFGFAWSPFKSGRLFVVRGHTGLFYAASPMLLFSGATNNLRIPPGDVSLQLSSVRRPDGSNFTVYQQLLAAGVDLNRSTLGSLPVIAVDVVERASALALGGTARDPFIGAALTLMAPDFRNPRSFQGGLGFETEVTSRWIAGAQLNYVNTVWLHRNRDYNMPVPVVRATDITKRPWYGLNAGVSRPIPQQSTLTVRESSARSMYRGVTFQTQYRGPKFQWGAFYTVAENFADDDSERDAGGVNHVDSFDFKQEYNYSSLDFRQQFNTYALYSLPWGVEISGLLRVRTGLPLNPIAGSDLNANLVNNDRPYSAPGVPFLRNSFRNRAVKNADMRLLKSFNLKGESKRIQLSAELFNLLNIDNVIFAGNTNVYGPGIDTAGNPVAPNAGFMLLRGADGNYNRVNTQVGNPFQAQFGLRFFW
jgi:hypothetical protein